MEKFVTDWFNQPSKLSPKFKKTISKYLVITPQSKLGRIFGRSKDIAKFNPIENVINLSLNGKETDWDNIDRDICYEAVILLAKKSPLNFFSTFKPILIQFFKTILSKMSDEPYEDITVEALVDIMISYEKGKISKKSFEEQMRPLYGTYKQDGSYVWDSMVVEPDHWFDSFDTTLTDITKIKNWKHMKIDDGFNLIYFTSAIIASMHSTVAYGHMKPLHKTITKLLK